MIDTYKGESAGKKLARCAFWQRCLFRRPEPRRIAFLASREGGDVGTLSALGVPISSMVGIERNEEAASQCRINVEPRTVAAWKAHATRGTYDRAAP